MILDPEKRSPSLAQRAGKVDTTPQRTVISECLRVQFFRQTSALLGSQSDPYKTNDEMFLIGNRSTSNLARQKSEANFACLLKQRDCAAIDKLITFQVSEAEFR